MTGELRAALGAAIHALNLARKDAERRGDDASIYVDALAEISPLRYSE